MPAITSANVSGLLTPEQSAPIFERAQQMSVFQQLIPQTPLGANGQAIPVVTTEPTADWAAEGASKHVTNGALSVKTMQPQKLTSIFVVSAEVVRANPANFLQIMRDRVASAFAVAFDRAVARDEGGTGTAGGGPFAANLDQTTKTSALGAATVAKGGIHADIVKGLELLSDDDKDLTGFALDNRLEHRFLGAVDSTGRPLYTTLATDDNSPAYAKQGRLLGRPSYMSRRVGAAKPGTAGAKYTVAYGGDWTQAAWGVVGGISYDVSSEASVTIDGTLVSLWEKNLVAVRAEAEYGFVLNDPAAFVKYQLTV